MNLKEYLRGLDRTALLRLLELRPDILVEPAPRHWDGLVKALTTQTSLAQALQHLDQDALTLTQALQVLGPGATPTALATTLNSPQPLVNAALSRLTERALTWPTTPTPTQQPPTTSHPAAPHATGNDATASPATASPAATNLPAANRTAADDLTANRGPASHSAVNLPATNHPPATRTAANHWSANPAAEPHLPKSLLPEPHLAYPPRLATWWPTPLGLGAPAADLLAQYPLPEIRALAARHKLPAKGTRAALTQQLAARLNDRPHLTRLLNSLPPAAAELLTTLRAGSPHLDLTDEALTPAAALLLDLGLLLRRGKSAAEVPREVGLALFDHHRHRLTGAPQVVTSPATPELAENQAAVAAAEAVRSATTLLENAEAEPIPALLSGGIGTRELRRLARSFACPPEQAALWLDLVHAAGLLGHHHAGHHVDSYAPTAAYDTWRTQPAAQRWTTLARTWLTLQEAPTHRYTPDGRPIPPTVPNPGPAQTQRQAVLTTYAALPPHRRATPTAVLQALTWHLPLLTASDHNTALTQAAITEAQLLGILAEDQLTPPGAALLHATHLPTSPTATAPTTAVATGIPGPPPPPESATPPPTPTPEPAPTPDAPAVPPDPEAALLAAVTALLPATSETTRLQSDLTAIVTGDPAQHLVRLLDTVADLESSSAARVWRFSPASVRRALDTGATAEDLLADLAAVAPDGVPQPLAYLVHDVSRRHGSIRVVDAGCVLHTADEIQALEILNSRPLARLALRQVAPAVLVSPRPRPETLALLRRAGFTPVGEDFTGNEVPEDQTPRRGRAQPAPWRPEDHVTSPAALAAVLADSTDADEPLDPDTQLRVQAPELPAADRGWLAAAARDGGAVEIVYRGPAGVPAPRVVSDLTLESGIMLAWCHRHETEAHFLLDRVTRARPIAGPVPAGGRPQ